jgi:hypothetical protein
MKATDDFVVRKAPGRQDRFAIRRAYRQDRNESRPTGVLT